MASRMGQASHTIKSKLSYDEVFFLFCLNIYTEQYDAAAERKNINDWKSSSNSNSWVIPVVVVDCLVAMALSVVLGVCWYRASGNHSKEGGKDRLREDNPGNQLGVDTILQTPL